MTRDDDARPGEACPDDETPAQRLRAALELTDLTERMLLQRLIREGSTDEEARESLAAWRAGPGSHADDAWFVARRAKPLP